MTHRLSEFLRFGIVGLISFIADTGLFFLLVVAGTGDYLARAISITLVMQLSYLLNMAFTFRNHDGHNFRRWRHFIGSNLVGCGISYAVFVLVLSSQIIHSPHLLRLAGIIAGTAVAFFFNYWISCRFIFAPRKH